ncbi:myosin heavy chain, partial [Brachionus plicatilis]
MQAQIEDEQRQRDEAREAAAQAERRANILASELDEIRVALEQAERARKAAENELHEAADRISELGAANSSLGAQKRKLESDIATMQADLDEAIAELKNSEERVKKASADAARLAEELRLEQEHSVNVEKLRKSLEQQVKDLQVRLDEAEANALKGGKRIIQKLEQ